MFFFFFHSCKHCKTSTFSSHEYMGLFIEEITQLTALWTVYFIPSECYLFYFPDCSFSYFRGWLGNNFYYSTLRFQSSDLTIRTQFRWQLNGFLKKVFSPFTQILEYPIITFFFRSAECCLVLKSLKTKHFFSWDIIRYQYQLLCGFEKGKNAFCVSINKIFIAQITCKNKRFYNWDQKHFQLFFPSKFRWKHFSSFECLLFGVSTT